MLTGLVYIAVVVLWAVVLVPQWLRRHDRNAEHRTTLTFHRAMRTLERRRASRGVSRASHDMDVIVAGARSRVHDRVSLDHGSTSAIDIHLDHGVDPFVGGVEESELRETRKLRREITAREVAAQRRKQVLQVLMGVSVISMILLVMGMIPLMLALLPPIALGVFWYLARQQATAAALASDRRARRDAARTASMSSSNTQASNSRASGSRSSKSSASRSSSSKTRRTATRHIDQPAPTAPSAGAGAGDEDIRLLSNEEVATRRAATAVGAWAPVESPSLRTAHDMPTSGDWTSERMLEQAEALRSPGADIDSELGLDEFVEVPGHGDQEHDQRYRRAVND